MLYAEWLIPNIGYLSDLPRIWLNIILDKRIGERYQRLDKYPLFGSLDRPSLFCTWTPPLEQAESELQLRSESIHHANL